MPSSRRALLRLAAVQRSPRQVPRQSVPAPAPDPAAAAGSPLEAPPAAGAAAIVNNAEPLDPVVVFGIERYRHILAQIGAANENVHRFLAIYQAIASAAVTAALALFVGYRRWGIAVGVARTGVIGLACLQTVAALFAILLIFIGMLTWLDYRREECELTDELVRPGFRKPPRIGNSFRWYETYIILFIVVSTGFLWFFALVYILPNMR